jgi:serine/threonine protein kinase
MNTDMSIDTREIQEPVQVNLEIPVSGLPVFKDKNITIIEKLGDSRYPTFVVRMADHNRLYALKLFKQKGNKLIRAYMNEARFIGLKHKHIINIISNVHDEEITVSMKPCQASYIVMELAICDFDDLLNSLDFENDEVLIRTYFHQLIEGIAYLHDKRIAHLDLKVQNLLLGNDFMLKISDFDLAFKCGDKTYAGKGTSNFRAPELIEANYEYVGAADIYSAGIILFVMRLGFMPYNETKDTAGVNFYNVLMSNPENFWNTLDGINSSTNSLSDDFKSLFLSMVVKDPLKRATVEQIMCNPWYMGEIYDDKQLQKIIRNKIRP